MKHLIFFCATFLTTSLYAQTLESEFSQKKMRKDLEVFRQIRTKANSGLYKYRTPEQIDSIYNWAFNEISLSKTYREFYNIICRLTDFEGSLHNDTGLRNEVYKSMKKENAGYFPFPLKMIEGKMVFNYTTDIIPLGAEILSINGLLMENILPNLYPYYTTDGINISGKSIGVNRSFSKYYRLFYGLKDSFEVVFKAHTADKAQTIAITGVSYVSYYQNEAKRYSATFDAPNYKNWEENEVYTYKKVNESTGILTVNSFSMGNESSKEHAAYLKFLEGVFAKIKLEGLKNLIVDIRYNGGGTDPNDLVTYSFLTQRNFSENKQAWISFNKIPELKYIQSNVPAFLRPLGVGKYNRMISEDFLIQKENGFYQNELSADHKIRTPNKNAFTGKVYLLISPRVASAGSLFAAMVAGNENTVVIGEETMGGYYGHNGHTSLSYVLPKSKIETSFSIVNLEQDVPSKENQIYNRGIIPDFKVAQTYVDYLNHVDTQMNFTLDLIERGKD